MLRFYCLISLTLFLLNNTIMAQSATPNIIKTNIKHMQRCWNTGDMKCAMNFYLHSNRTVCADTQQVITGFKHIKKHYQDHFQGKMGTLHLKLIYLQQLAPNIIISIAKIKFFYQHKHRTGLTSLVWQKNYSGHWKIILDHSS